MKDSNREIIANEKQMAITKRQLGIAIKLQNYELIQFVLFL